MKKNRNSSDGCKCEDASLGKNHFFKSFGYICTSVAVALSFLIPLASVASCDKAGWNVSEELLYWHGHEKGIGYTNRPANILITDDFTQKGVFNPTSEGDLGVRLGARYGRDCKWGFQAYWTYFKSKAHGRKNFNSGAPEFLGIYPIWSMGPDTLAGDYVSSASLNWHLYANIADLIADYKYSCFCDRLVLLPFLGGRGVFLNQRLNAQYAGGTFFSGVDENALKSRYFAGGPRLGANADCDLICNFSIFGRGAVAPLFGNIHREQRETYLENTRFHRSDINYRFVLSTDYEIGLRWKGSIVEDQLDAILSIAWEGQEFFYLNSFYRGKYHFFEKERALYMQGLTFGIALDF